ncbi:hypothetical protein DM02DRAFT_525848 [Periconia macrospinosa]|uniref:Copper acquisition factor BIM1-like domain-containing protein n=1 Tax=Periconia macrospinosa TaxID=97972 RepID=A0A2V1DS15_9PLEO|nr:hypothetical protein DM02DRAFT_525848 [Periconia macrospinosa]
MLPGTITPLLALAGVASAHYRVLAPAWRANSLTTPGASQWVYPCANVTELSATNSSRTQWPLTGGSLKINGSHEYALTYVNLGLGTNVSDFDIPLLHDFNQTGAGVFCLKDAVRDALKKGFEANNVTEKDRDGLHATLQFVQISHGGGALYNCADITFSSSAQLLADDQCQNATGVGGEFLHSSAVAQGGHDHGNSGGNGQSAASALKGSSMAAVVAGGLSAWLLV